MREQSTALRHHFDDLAQQEEADALGMWTFLATEILLFGGLFLGYAVYRSIYPEAWAEGSRHNDIVLGTINTAVLLVSSLAVALAVHFAELERWRSVYRYLGATAGLGVVFLAIKFYEYYVHVEHGLLPGVHFELESAHTALFFVFYFAMTGLHAIHMIVGIGLVALLALGVGMKRLRRHVTVEMVGLYWHLIDIIWVFLFPLLYLVR